MGRKSSELQLERNPGLGWETRTTVPPSCKAESPSDSLKKPADQRCTASETGSACGGSHPVNHGLLPAMGFHFRYCFGRPVSILAASYMFFRATAHSPGQQLHLLQNRLCRLFLLVWRIAALA